MPLCGGVPRPLIIIGEPGRPARDLTVGCANDMAAHLADTKEATLQRTRAGDTGHSVACQVVVLYGRY